MAEMIIMLRRDKTTGKQNIIVKLDSEPDALPIEHEQLHRKLVKNLLGIGLDPDDLGEMIIEREPEQTGTIVAESPEDNEKQQEAAKS